MKSKYDSSRHVLVEQCMMKKELCLLGIYPCTVAGRKTCECKDYNDHVNSLRTIPCSPSFEGVHDQIYEEGKDYEAKFCECYQSDKCQLNNKAKFTRCTIAHPIPVDNTEESAEVMGKLIDQHIGKMWGGLEMSSVQYFIDTGKINGSFRLRLLALLQFYEWHIERTPKQEGKEAVFTKEQVRQFIEDILWEEYGKKDCRLVSEQWLEQKLISLKQQTDKTRSTDAGI